MRARFEFREAGGADRGRQPRYEALLCRGPRHFYAVARDAAGERTEARLLRLTLDPPRMRGGGSGR
jgi:hypothetical protein